jgi:hypothetical protein
MDIKELLKSLKAYNKGNTEYYNIIDFYSLVRRLSVCSVTEELLIVPFYLSEKITYEIYEYQLNIRIVEQPCFDKYMLNMTGKKCIQDIETDIWNKRKQCDIEVLDIERSNIIENLRNYINYLLQNPKLENEIYHNMGEYDIHNIYIAIY